MTATLPPAIKFQPLVGGVPLPGGKVYFFEAGTTTPQAVYAADGITSIGNSLTLDANGATSFRLGAGLAYKIDLFDANNVHQAGWPEDNIQDIASLAARATDLASSVAGKGSALVAWNPAVTYPDGSVGKQVSALSTGLVTTMTYNPTAAWPNGSVGKQIASTSAAGQTQALMAKLKRGQEDAAIVVLGDSTGNEATEWVYKMALALAALFPTHTVKYTLWDGAAYPLPTTLATGSGSKTLTIYNGSVSGSLASYSLGARFSPMVESLKPDLVFISYGHNQFTADWAMWASNYLEITENVALSCAYAGIICILQNPSQVDNQQALRATVYQRIALKHGYGIIDVHQVFLDYGAWAADLMADSVHPNAVGQDLWVAEVMKSFTYKRDMQMQPHVPSLSMAGSQLIKNGDFSLWDEGSTTPPVGWTVGGGAITFAADTINGEGAPFKYPLKLTATAGAGAYIARELPLSKVKGKWVTVAARVFVPAGSGLQAGRLEIGTNLGTTRNDDGTANGQGGWTWRIVQTYFDPALAPAYAKIWIWPDMTAGGASMSIDQLSIVIGDVPMGLPSTNWDSDQVRVAGKAFIANGASTTLTYPARKTHVYITTSAASLATTLPATSLDMDGLVISLVAGSAVATATWVAGAGGAAIVGAPAALSANVPVRMIFNFPKNTWYPF
jgi:hypothetical protein